MPQQLPGPVYSSAEFATAAQTDQWKQWIAGIVALKQSAKDRYGIDDSEYKRPDLEWTQSSFVQPQMMVEDRYFYDVSSGKYTVARYLDDVNKRYGGIDSVLIWLGYPNLGIDNRNLYDLIDDLPGGRSAVRKVIEEFHRSGVHVLFPVFTWDQGTRSPNKPAWEAISEILTDLGADGINGDTLAGLPRVYRVTSDKLHHPLALEPELGLAIKHTTKDYPSGADEMLGYNTMSWGYWEYGFVPALSRYKWLEPRHMVHLCERFSHDHTAELQAAFFNGIGFESWENVWGIWNGMNPRDAEALRRIAAIDRQFSRLLISAAWRPHTPTEQFGVFASEWPTETESLYTIVNRNHYTVSGRQLVVKAQPGYRYFDLWHGVQLHPLVQGDQRELSFEMDADGFGAILATSADPISLIPFLKRMAEYSARPLGTLSNEWKALPQKAVPILATASAINPPKDMVRIPAGDFVFRVRGTEVEGGDDVGVDVQYSWESLPRREHTERIHINEFWIDQFPVTNTEFKAFMDATGYRPRDIHNFLHDWINGTYPRGWDKKPVTWVSLDDARAYATWAKKRLPHEWEWQYAAQGTDGRTYPWGNEWNTAAVATPERGRVMLPPSDVDAHPAGASPFGVMDLVGNVWQWTDEYNDNHTRAAILRGGSHYTPAYHNYSNWYFPQTKSLNEHSKLLLMAPSIDRSATIGFRCAKDISVTESSPVIAAIVQ